MEYQNLQKKYRENFDSKEYRKCLMDHFELYEFYLKTIHELFTKGTVKGEGNLLEFGCGPLIAFSATMSKYFNDITMSEFLPQNREQVQMWMSNDKDAINWTPFLEEVARLEGFENLQEGKEVIANRLRKSFKRIVPCNALEDPMIPEIGNETFNVVGTSLCLEAATLDAATYKKCMLKLGNLLREGGTLIVCGITHAPLYSVGGSSFECIDLTEDLIRSAIQEAGLHLVDFCKRASNPSIMVTPYENVFVATARRGKQ